LSIEPKLEVYKRVGYLPVTEGYNPTAAEGGLYRKQQFQQLEKTIEGSGKT
jgi:hypothetical protein